MIGVRWQAKSQHYTEMTKEQMIDWFDLPVDKDATEDEVIDAFHAKLEDREDRGATVDYFVERSDDSTWSDTFVDSEDIEAEAVSSDRA